MTTTLSKIDPNTFAKNFATTVRDIANMLATLSGTTDSIRATESPSTIETIALRVARYALCKDTRNDMTEGSIDILARVATNKLMSVEDEPDYESILRNANKFVPNSDVDAVIIGAHARRCIELRTHVRVAWLAVFAGISYENCAMHLHRGRLKGSNGLVTSTSAKKWLVHRSDEEFERILRTTRDEAMPVATKRKRATR